MDFRPQEDPGHVLRIHEKTPERAALEFVLRSSDNLPTQDRENRVHCLVHAFSVGTICGHGALV
uniref:hypothetical protein n=1 Tax=Vibrio cidicii TaxID=1763883 RepID=UPI003704A22A